MLDMWYPRMADIPGISFTGSPGIKRSELSNAGVRPRTDHGYIAWPSASGTTSASPAHDRAFADLSRLSRGELVRWVWEGLELPGLPSDYHFLLQGAVKQLWSGHRDAPEGLHFLEVFGYLDLALIEAAPQTVRLPDTHPTGGFVHVTSLELLLSLLEREGAVREALELSGRAAKFGVLHRREDLKAKVASLDEEQA